MTFKPTQEWQENCIEDLRATDIPITDLARKYFRSTTTIKKLLRLSGVTRPPERKKNPSCTEAEPISREHRRVGVKLTLLRKDQSLQEMADLLGFSVLKLRKMEVGQQDFTLTELLHISETLGEPLNELLAEPTLKRVS